MNDAAALLGLAIRVDPSELVTDQRFMGEGYGIPSADIVLATEARWSRRDYFGGVIVD